MSVITKFKSKTVLMSLAIISIIGFALNSYSIYTGSEIPESFAYANIILGFGLIFESEVVKFLKNRSLFLKQENEYAKVITFTVGIIILIGGILTTIQFPINDMLVGAFGVSNFIALIVVGYETFLVD